jgi:hypothetical protein
MFNNQLNNSMSSSPSKERKLEQFYSIYNNNNNGESQSEQHLLESNINVENEFPVNNKIQLLKLRFNQLNSQSNSNIINNNTKQTNDLNKNYNNQSMVPVKNQPILPYYQYQRPNISNKETIIEDCKQSLDELLKASKWKMHSSIPVRFAGTEQQSTDNQQNSYKSTLQLKLKPNDSGNSL